MGNNKLSGNRGNTRRGVNSSKDLLLLRGK